MEGWQNRHPEDNEEFVAQSEKVCQTYLDVPELATAEQVTHTGSLCFSSFWQKPESRDAVQILRDWISAFAGMTVF